MLKGLNRKNYSFSSQLIDNLKLYMISKNQPTMSIKRGDMRVPPFLTLKNGCPSIISPPNQAIRSWNLICRALDVPFRNIDLLALLHPPSSHWIKTRRYSTLAFPHQQDSMRSINFLILSNFNQNWWTPLAFSICYDTIMKIAWLKETKKFLQAKLIFHI